MPRFKEHQLQLVGLIGRFETDSSSTHVRNALAAIGRLKDAGAKVWNEDPQKLRRWQEYCATLWTFLNSSLRQRRHLKKQDLATINRHDVPSSLHRCVATTNVIESPQSGVRKKTGNVCRWRDGEMILRWAAGAFLLTEKKFRRTMGYQDLCALAGILGRTSIATAAEKEKGT